MPRSLFPASLGGTASLAPWWPFSLALHVAGAWGNCWVGEGHSGLFSPSWSLITRLPETQGMQLLPLAMGRGQEAAMVDARAQEKREYIPSEGCDRPEESSH